jgi:hypothetical protein
LIIYPGRSIIGSVNRLIRDYNVKVIVVAQGKAAVEWKEKAPGVMVIDPNELPRWES